MVNTVIAAADVAVADVVRLLDSCCYLLMMLLEAGRRGGRRRKDGECTKKPEPQSNDMGN